LSVSAEPGKIALEVNLMPMVEEPSTVATIYCPVAATMNLLNQKWTLHIIRELMSSKRRFNELAHRVGGVNSRTLRERLRVLEEEDIVVRHVVNTIPPWVEYELTDKGHALNSVIESIAAWGRRWMADRVSRCTEQGGPSETESALCPEKAAPRCVGGEG
jgi:DNA-binding HxlR family transcriptional regulator